MAHKLGMRWRDFDGKQLSHKTIKTLPTLVLWNRLFARFVKSG